MRFLLVEDEYYARKALRQSVAGWQQNAVIAEADNGVSALALMEQASFDVVLMDIRMPQMDGLALAEQIHERWKETYMVMITGYGEFEYAQAAIRMNVRDYLLKPVDDDLLCEALTRAQEDWEQRRQRALEEQALQSDGADMRLLLRRHRLRQWLTGQEAEAPAEFAGQSCMVLCVFGFTVAASQAEKELERFLAAQAEACWELLPETGDELCVLARYRAQRPSGASRLALLRRLRAELLENGVEARVAASGLIPAQDAPAAYAQALQARQYRLLRSDSLLSFDALAEQTAYVSLPDAAALTDYAICLSQGQAAQACALARQAVQRLSQQPGASLLSLRDALNRLCACMNTAIAQSVTQEGTGEAELLQVELRTEDFDTQAALIRRLEALTTQVCALSERVPVSSADQVVGYLRQYVADHYGDNVSLKELAESRIYLNPSYLSRLFKAKTGTSFKNFLTQVRMDHARQMLSARECSVMTIAGECGYADASQFIQLFRKRYGVTPSVYRERQAGYDAEDAQKKQREEEP